VVYKGHMMAAKEDRNRGEYVCVDDARVMHERSNGQSQDGVHWYKVEVRCGGSNDNSPLPCGAYVQHREMACAVCRVPDARSADMKNTFVRFGSRTCAESQIYEGYIGSADANAERGGGVNFLCLHHSPTYGAFDQERDDSDNNLSYIYGAEYRSTGSLDRNINEDAACSVCGTHNRGTHTVWGRTTCPYPGWVMEFTGYAMSTRSRVNNDHNNYYGAGYHMSSSQSWSYQSNEYTYSKKETICVDEKRQPHQFSNPDEAHNDGSTDNANNPTEGSGQLYTTEFRQTIFSGTYPEGSDLPCVVCSMPSNE